MSQSTEHTLETITQCEALPTEQGLNTNHFPIISNFDINVELTPKKVISNFRDVDWEDFRNALDVKIRNWGVPNFISLQEMLNQECKRLTSALQETIDKKVLNVVLGPQAKCWWTKELMASCTSEKTCSKSSAEFARITTNLML